MTVGKRTKWSVSLAVRRDSFPGQVLMVRRPEGDDEFPGMWGLPAGTCRPDESTEAAALRTGVEKLGAEVTLGPVLGSGRQARSEYDLVMTLFEGRLPKGLPILPEGSDHAGITMYTAWRWGDPRELEQSASHGSLCSLLLLEHLADAGQD